MNSISIIIPTRNERDNIVPLLERITTAVSALAHDTEIVFVDDGSTDGTRAAINGYKGLLPVRLICRDDETGLASAVCAGARAAAGDLLVVMDADLSHPPEVIPDLLQPLLDGSRDMVVGSRYIPGGSTPEWPWTRKAASRLATLPARLFTAIHDPLAGFFSIRRDFLLAVRQPVTGFKIALQILATSPDLRAAEVPITFIDRTQGISKMNSAVVVEYLKQLAALGGLPLEAVGKKELATLATGVVILDFLIFHLLQYNGFELGVVHIFSFLLACNLGYIITATTTDDPLSYFRPAALLRYQWILLPVLFLRGGIMAAMAPWFPDWSWLLSVAAACYSLCAATAGFLLVSGNRNRACGPVNRRLAMLLIVAYTVILRLLYFGTFELTQEEAYYWNYSQHMAMGYLDHPPMVALLIWVGTHLFGNSETGVRVGALVCWIITAWFSYRLTLSAFDRKIALNSLVLIAALPLFFGTALIMTPDAPLIACWAGTLFYLHRVLIDGDHRSWIGVGVWLGLGLLSKYTIILLGPATILFMVSDPRSRRWFGSSRPYLAAGTGLAVFSPVILWNYRHAWASFLFQSQHRLADQFMFSTPELVGSILLLLTPTGLFAVWAVGYTHRKLESSVAAHVADRRRRHRLFALCMAFVPLSVFVFFSFSREVKLSWAGPLWLACIPLMASSLPTSDADGRTRSVVQRAWSVTLVCLVLGYGLILHYFSLGIPGIPFNTGAFLFGGEDLADRVEQTVRRVEAKRGAPPVVIGMDKYQIASGLAFYRAKMFNPSEPGSSPQSAPETTGRHLFNLDSLMYAFWQAPAALTGRDLLVIADEEEKLDNRLFVGRAKELGKIRSFPVKKHGKEVGVYYYRLLTRYRSDGPVDHGAGTTPRSAIAVRPIFTAAATNTRRL